MPRIEASSARIEPSPSSFDAAVSLRASLAWCAGIAAAGMVVLALLVATGVLDAAAVLAALASIDIVTLAMVLALSLANYALRALRWHILTRQLAPEIPLTTNVAYFMTGFAFLVTPAKAGEVVRLWLLKDRHGVPYARSLGLMLVDRVADLGGLLAFAALGLLSHASHAGATAALILALVAAVAMLCSRSFVARSVRIAHALTGRRWLGFFTFALKAYGTLRRLCSLQVVLVSAVLTLLAWAAQIAGLWLVLQALGFHAGFLDSAFVFAFALLAGVIPVFPGGVGGAEAAMAGLLVLAGMPSGAAITATVVNRLATLWFAMLIGLVVAPLVMARGRLRSLATRPLPNAAVG